MTDKKAPPIRRQKNYIIRPINIREGMHVIVTKWLVDVDVEGSPDASSSKLVAVPLIVHAVALPFIVIECPTMGGMRGVLDTRKSEFMRVDKKFTESLLPRRKAIN